MHLTAETDKRRHLLDHVSRLEVTNGSRVYGTHHSIQTDKRGSMLHTACLLACSLAARSLTHSLTHCPHSLTVLTRVPGVYAWMQNEKRQLETNVVVEQRIQNRETESTASQSDDEQDEDDSGSVVSNGDGTEDVFFECNTELGRVSAKPILSGGASTSGATPEYNYPQGILLPLPCCTVHCAVQDQYYVCWVATPYAVQCQYICAMLHYSAVQC